MAFKPLEHLQQEFVIIYAPRRGKRIRYPEGCVEIQADEQTAIDGADPENNMYPAIAAGPFISSEGFRLFYLKKWLIACEDTD
ncbi:MAG: hypothetical protein HOM11_15405 [Methylococcales bacterium]|jgi:hypothetical protein|nr:hypothetical protein [Methylococcales bacterium]MBT7444857.1 hypothetical protein [Methylococcales bacterium]